MLHMKIVKGLSVRSEKSAYLAYAVEQKTTKVLLWRFIMNVSFVIVDCLVFFLTCVAFLSRDRYTCALGKVDSIGINPYAYAIVVALIWVLSERIAGVYHRHVFADGYELNARLVKGMFICCLSICAINYIINATIPCTSIFLICMVAWCIEVLIRFITQRLLVQQHEKGEYAYPTVVVGSPEGIGQVLNFLSQRRQLNYKPIRVCPIKINPETNAIESDDNEEYMRECISKNWHGDNIPILKYSPRLAHQIALSGAQTVMISDVLDRFSDNLHLFTLRMESMNLEVALITSACDIAGHATSIQNRYGKSIMTIYLPQFTPYSKLKKRIFDIIVSGIAIVLASPAMLIIALAIKLEDGGPIFYKQERIGLRGEPFYIHKFRSMRVGADKEWKKLLVENGEQIGGLYKMKSDPRITKVGKFIRKTSLDELPQFFDAFTGKMSVVGPRPFLSYEVEHFDSMYAMRSFVKPGITGPWQVSGRSDLSEEESRQLDVTYVQDWSIMGDFVYILRTIGTVIHPHGAY